MTKLAIVGYLVLNQGREEIVALHDRLYEGTLRSELRSDIPFVPHVTVAAHPSWKICEGLARELNLDLRTVRGTFRAVRGILRDVEMVEVGGAAVRSLLQFKLTDAASAGE